MLELYKNIKDRRVALNLTQAELALKMGYADKSMIAKIEKGQVDLPQSKIVAFANVLGVAPGTLMGWGPSAAPTSPGSELSTRIPVLGRVAAGIPFAAVEEIVDYEEIPDAMSRSGDYFGLKIRGDSMEPKFSDGDAVIVRKQDDADDGDIVIALVNGNDGCCKRLRKYRDSIALVSTNPLYDPMYFSNSEVDGIPVRIVGKVVELRAKF